MSKPRTFLVGYTSADEVGLRNYLNATGNEAFWEEYCQAREEGLSAGECLCSFYAKLCYKSLSEGKNANITRTRPIADNLEAVFKSGHGSVFEHCWLNFVTTDCSRVFTHELVRHRVGTAFSQTSGRYCAIDQIDIVIPPELEEARGIVESFAKVAAFTCKELRDTLIPEDADFATKKRITSAIRRLAPNGQTNEIGWSCNIRSMRHMIELRTSRHAEWEIRVVFNDVANIILGRFPLILYGHERVDTGDGLFEYTKLEV